MLHSFKAMRGYVIQALDGDCGRLHDVYFDDKRWSIRHLVVKTGGWLTGRKVLVAPGDLGKPDPQARAQPVLLTRQQVASGPHCDTHMPVSRQREAEIDGDSLPYGGAPCSSENATPAWNFGAVGGLTMEEEAAAEVEWENASVWTPFDDMLPRQEEADPHLRSAREVVGYSLQALDRPNGYVADFLVDERTWRISHLVVQTGIWLFGHRVLVPVESVREISWEQETVSVSLSRRTIRNNRRDADAARRMAA